MTTPNQLSELTRKLEAMTEERDFYRRELGLQRDADKVASMMTAFRLTRLEARIIDSMMASAPRPMTKEALLNAAWGDRADDVEIKIVDVFICKIRAKMGRECIETIWGHGYRMGEPGLAKIRAVLDPQAAAA